MTTCYLIQYPSPNDYVRPDNPYTWVGVGTLIIISLLILWRRRKRESFTSAELVGQSLQAAGVQSVAVQSVTPQDLEDSPLLRKPLAVRLFESDFLEGELINLLESMPSLMRPPRPEEPEWTVLWRFGNWGWDYYDSSLEIYGIEPEVRLTDEEQKRFEQAGFSIVFVNHTDGWETHYYVHRGTSRRSKVDRRGFVDDERLRDRHLQRENLRLRQLLAEALTRPNPKAWVDTARKMLSPKDLA